MGEFIKKIQRRMSKRQNGKVEEERNKALVMWLFISLKLVHTGGRERLKRMNITENVNSQWEDELGGGMNCVVRLCIHAACGGCDASASTSLTNDHRRNEPQTTTDKVLYFLQPAVAHLLKISTNNNKNHNNSNKHNNNNHNNNSNLNGLPCV